jgi:type II secretory pathway pseudopilin PulG
LEILLALGIMGIIAVFAISLGSSVRQGAKVGETENLMKEIAVKSRSYYRNTRSLPAPGGTGGTEIPVAADALNMEQKYRYDSWGTPFSYYRHSTIGTTTADGNSCAGYLVSAGPDQVLAAAGGYGSDSNAVTAEDDLLIPIDVSQEAVEIALGDLKVLQSKVAAFDAIYAGIDNNSDGTVDESGCAAVDSSVGNCPPTSWGDTIDSDPNCGAATLDAVDNTTHYGCTATDPLGFIREIYALGTVYQSDPWGHDYIWGSPPTYDDSNQRYHKFFSAGPNGVADDADDIVP